MNHTPKKKNTWQYYITIAFFVLIGVGGGILLTACLAPVFTSDRPLWAILSLLYAIYAAIFVQTILHEAGHLVFGLLSGYSFGSFRILSLMWIKENGKIRFKRFTVAGTSGQCLMAPPELADGKIPVVLYNLGGSLMNMITGFAFLALYILTARVPSLSAFMLMLAIAGFALAMLNGVPLRTKMIDNDGYNAISLRRNQAALRSFWIQLKVNEQISKGIRLKDMPEDWFSVPSDEDMINSMTAAIGVLACNRLMDQQRFADADALMSHLLEIESGISGLHRSMLLCDRIYCELIGKSRPDAAERMLTKEQQKFMKAMKRVLSVLRTEYAYALLMEKDVSRAEALKSQFEKCAKTYPYPGEIQAERELLEIAAKTVSPLACQR